MMSRTSGSRWVVLVALNVIGAVGLVRAGGPTYQGQTAARWEAVLASPGRMEAVMALQKGDPASHGVLQELAQSRETPVRIEATPTAR